MRYVWRHLPLNDVHPNAQLAAEAAEAAAAQGRFWEMHDLLLDHQDALRVPDLIGYAEAARARRRALRRATCAATPAPRASPRTSTAPTSAASPARPTFFVNGRRHYGAYDIATLSSAVKAARARAAVAAG